MLNTKRSFTIIFLALAHINLAHAAAHIPETDTSFFGNRFGINCTQTPEQTGVKEADEFIDTLHNYSLEIRETENGGLLSEYEKTTEHSLFDVYVHNAVTNEEFRFLGEGTRVGRSARIEATNSSGIPMRFTWNYEYTVPMPVEHAYLEIVDDIPVSMTCEPKFSLGPIKGS